MSASSQYRRVAEVQKVKKVERRNAAIKRYQEENNRSEHIEAEVGGVPAEASSGDSPEPIKTEAKKKPAAKKAASAKKRGASKKVFSNSKAAAL